LAQNKRVNRDANRALLGAYRNSILRYQKLLNTHVAEDERDYIKERLSACAAAVKALNRPAIDTYLEISG
jgi:hypothetical protein